MGLSTSDAMLKTRACHTVEVKFDWSLCPVIVLSRVKPKISSQTPGEQLPQASSVSSDVKTTNSKHAASFRICYVPILAQVCPSVNTTSTLSRDPVLSNPIIYLA